MVPSLPFYKHKQVQHLQILSGCMRLKEKRNTSAQKASLVKAAVTGRLFHNTRGQDGGYFKGGVNESEREHGRLGVL